MALIVLTALTPILLALAAIHLDARATATAATAPDHPIADNLLPADPAWQMTLAGRVLDPVGKASPNAAVMVIVRSKYATRPLLEHFTTGATSTYEGRADESGQFRIDLPRTTSVPSTD